ncbi:hypothetical protein BHU72_02125 [Desulfuribacillus stibiiarsenatis]|uniref:Prepilin-type N-terminal cleavage/methylation domain-containing protein n=1 Tax=Desulfuribacillus stibiiarsenatis TaxID=1390249 RepID=A0A1E5L6I6_9FIRM|nr:hypothetical protein [Desulfuribacillus stibiiarsenatis]OEH85619.1 hypothetical protein BHU72_02125 [Desulfuribacillus stibiiarsenatis]
MSCDKSSNQGMVLVDVLLSIQIFLVLILFMVTTITFHREAMNAQDNQQTALYILQSELEQYIARREPQDQSWVIESDNYPVFHITFNTVSVEHSLWLITGIIQWEQNKKSKEITLATYAFQK